MSKSLYFTDTISVYSRNITFESSRAAPQKLSSVGLGDLFGFISLPTSSLACADVLRNPEDTD